MNARGGIRAIDLIKGLKLRIPAEGPPVHVYPTEHHQKHTHHTTHVVAEPEPSISYSHVSHASYSVPHAEPHHHHDYGHHHHYEPHHSYAHDHYGSHSQQHAHYALPPFGHDFYGHSGHQFGGQEFGGELESGISDFDSSIFE
jgi:hypothetical protein